MAPAALSPEKESVVPTGPDVGAQRGLTVSNEKENYFSLPVRESCFLERLAHSLASVLSELLRLYFNIFCIS
jgi:hypothetical protein